MHPRHSTKCTKKLKCENPYTQIIMQRDLPTTKVRQVDELVFVEWRITQESEPIIGTGPTFSQNKCKTPCFSVLIDSCCARPMSKFAIPSPFTIQTHTH